MANHAVIIGVDRYMPEMLELTGAVADAIVLATWLVESGEVAPADLHLALAPTAMSPPMPSVLAGCARSDATIDAIDDLLVDFLVNPRVDMGRFWFAFSGHGASSAVPAYVEDALCLEGFTGKAHRKALELTSLMGVLAGIAAEERFILLDGCRNILFEDDVRFGTLSRQPRPAPGERRDHVLRATGPGRKAAEQSGRGLFSRHFVEGLKGAGSAKRWDPEADDGRGAYRVRWDALKAHVDAAVAATPGIGRVGQLVYEGGERPAGSNPLLATFPETAFGRAAVTVRLVAPTPPPPGGATIVLRRNDSQDEDCTEAVDETGVARFSVPRSAFVVWARAPGWQSQPRQRPILVYDDEALGECALAPELPEPPPRSQPPAPERPFAVAAEMAARTIDRPPPPDWGTLRLLIAGRIHSEVRPAVRVLVALETGGVIPNFDAKGTMLRAGVYRIAVETSTGALRQTLAIVESGEITELDIALPDTATPALVAALAAANKPPPSAGFAMPSEAVGPLVAPTLATVGALAVGQAVQGLEFDLAELGLGRTWLSGKVGGVELVIADDSGSVARPPRARLWRMQRKNSGVQRIVARPRAGVPLATAGLVAEPGGYWLELQDSDRARRAGFKLGTMVLPGYVTLVVRHQLESGGVALLQFAIPRHPECMGDILTGLAISEAVQRARTEGRDPLTDANVRALADGGWFEPFAAIVSAVAVLERGDPMFARRLLRRLWQHEISTVDTDVLDAATASAGTAPPQVAIRRALDRQAAPVSDNLLERLDAAARRHELFGPEQRWIAEKLGQSVGHPLFTLRREDDLKRSARPDAMG